MRGYLHKALSNSANKFPTWRNSNARRPRFVRNSFRVIAFGHARNDTGISSKVRTLGLPFLKVHDGLQYVEALIGVLCICDWQYNQARGLKATSNGTHPIHILITYSFPAWTPFHCHLDTYHGKDCSHGRGFAAPLCTFTLLMNLILLPTQSLLTFGIFFFKRSVKDLIYYGIKLTINWNRTAAPMKGNLTFGYTLQTWWRLQVLYVLDMFCPFAANIRSRIGVEHRAPK